MKKQIIAYVHSHWDREWYREFEIFRMRLLRVFDNVLDMLENDTLPSFYFDGQTKAMLDYLEIRPEKEEQIRRFVKDKRLFIGPFYCLVDEFLTDENCFRKNLDIGLKTSRDFGCTDFIGYFADTFGHSASTIPILKEYGIDTAIAWRGLGDVPSEFTWKFDDDNKINAINLVRGYFNDVFSTPWDIHKKAEFLKLNLDKIAEKSGDILLLPIGADHLGVETDLLKQVNEVNTLLDDYEIKIGSIFDYINAVQSRFSEYELQGELRDNSKTFVLEGCYSARLDLKKYNIQACHKLNLAEKLVKYLKIDKYLPLIDYAYEMLLQNQAHDSICGCSTDDVHAENIIRYKKILQIANNIIDEINFDQKSKDLKVINLSDKNYRGTVEFTSTKDYPYQILNIKRGFDKNLLADTQRIPVTEDYTDIKTYCAYADIPTGTSDLKESVEETDVFVTDNCIGNSKIFLIVEHDEIRVGDKILRFLDYTDNGDTYNTGYKADDVPTIGKVKYSRIYLEGNNRSTLRLDVKIKDDVLHCDISLDKDSPLLHFHIEWENSEKNHLLQVAIDTGDAIETTYSEDFSNIIKRSFAPNYDVRQNLPKTKGLEVKTSTAPMHRGVVANNVGFVTEGITQYEVFERELKLPLLRSVGVISNPKNEARTTPAGPPIEVNACTQMGHNVSDFWIFLGDNLRDMIDDVFNECVVIGE